jgi:hypothetical protein
MLKVPFEYQEIRSDHLADDLNRLSNEGWWVIAPSPEWALLCREKPGDRRQLTPARHPSAGGFYPPQG